ncbi:hypothetical protein [Microbacterium sp. RURRCA19A]|uniref:hypothetical protein n=1 Tax=Microbacterium sp. RURRCA19A TaxID=1907391 RepID=UPI0009562C08|nr:hypothetical protein [Microbacterium sp. RURRCA19A]SIS02047.1 hypothetical protein SAMN05880568_2443 [Microbacterium sp. RURRCA19A]
MFARLPLPAALVGILLLALAAPASATAADGGVAWTVRTADNAYGTGRANFTYDTVEPGAVISDTMIVVNTGTEPLPLAVYAADAFTASTGEIDVLVDGQPSRDAGTWVSVDTTPLSLSPGQSAEVPFTITVPVDARPGDHGAGIVTSLTSTDPTSTLSVDRRLGTRITLRVAGELTPAASVSAASARYEASWNPFDSGRIVVEYALENTGNTRLTGAETLATAGLFGARTAPTQLTEVLPGSTVRIAREIPAFSLGWVAGSVDVTPEAVGLGAAPLAPVTAGFSIVAVPWSLYALLALILAAVLTAVLLVRHRRAAASAAAAAQAD